MSVLEQYNVPPLVAVADHLGKTYATENGSVRALDDVSFQIPQGEFVMLSGDSAAGKSTLLSILEGITPPTDGEVHLFGQNVTRWPKHKLDKLKAQMIGVGTQDALIDRSWSVADNIRQTQGANGREIKRDRIVQLASMFGMLDKLMLQTGMLSGGEQARVSLMKSMAHNPDLLLLDEPTGRLAHDGKLEVFRSLHKLAKDEGKTVIMIAHEAEMARDFVDREIRLADGKLVDEKVYTRTPGPAPIFTPVPVDVFMPAFTSVPPTSLTD